VEDEEGVNVKVNIVRRDTILFYAIIRSRFECSPLGLSLFFSVFHCMYV